MTKKTTKPKVAKKVVKNQKISKSAVMIAVLIAVVVFGVLTALIVKERRDLAIKQDRARFTEIERRLENLREKLSVNGEEWKIEKSCDKPNAKFYTGEAGVCDVSVVYNGPSVWMLSEVESILEAELGSINGRGRDDSQNKNFVSFAETGMVGVGCSFYFNGMSNDKPVGSSYLNCESRSLQMYFPEV